MATGTGNGASPPIGRGKIQACLAINAGATFGARRVNSAAPGDHGNGKVQREVR